MGIRLLRIAGIDVHLDWSLAIIFVLIAGSLALGVFPAWHPDRGAGLAWGMALAAKKLGLLALPRPPVDETAHKGAPMLKVLAWIVVIIFLIGLLVVFGVLDFIF